MTDPDWPTAADWLAGEGKAGEVDLVVVGVPLSETSISQPCGAHETPAAVRRRLARLSVYNSERDVDVAPVRVYDAGDLNPQPSHEEIAAAAGQAGSAKLAVFLGGDNAITFPAMTGLAGDRLASWGLVTLDAHHDVRTYDGRPGNGSVVRALIDAGLPGEQVVQVGILGFSNSAPYRRWCEEVGIEVMTAAEARFSTIEEVMSAAFQRLALVVDHIYVDLDVDVLDSAFAPACPGARPGGLNSRELFAAAFLSGRDPLVRAVDIVEVDAAADPGDRTVDVAALCLLNVAAGLVERLE
jgi:formiminoglutamase